jgi:hypothetical protein
MAVAGDMTVPVVCPARAASADQGAEAATDEASEAAHARFVSAGFRTYEAHALKAALVSEYRPHQLSWPAPKPGVKCVEGTRLASTTGGLAALSWLHERTHLAT